MQRLNNFKKDFQISCGLTKTEVVTLVKFNRHIINQMNES